jgi:uncharacterized protein (DUF433 family)
MDILPTVIRAEYRGEYRIHVTFNDGVENTIDFAPWLDGPIFEPLTLIDYLAAGDSLEAFLKDFPSVSREHAVAVLEMAKSALLAKAVAA